MNIPDCYDPADQEDKRQAEWDKFADNLPVCGCCGRSIYTGSRYCMLNVRGEYLNVCESCKDRMEDEVHYVREDDF